MTEVSATNLHYGHAAVANDDFHIAAPIFRPIEAIPISQDGSGNSHRRPFCQSMKEKALQASNTFRQMLGLDPIKPDIRVRPAMHHAHHIELESGVSTTGAVIFKDGKPFKDGALPVLPFVGTPVRPAFAPEGEEMDNRGRRPVWANRPHHRLHGSFLRRVHHALMSLGPWEGRAVAFVLGEYYFCPLTLSAPSTIFSSLLCSISISIIICLPISFIFILGTVYADARPY